MTLFNSQRLRDFRFAGAVLALLVLSVPRGVPQAVEAAPAVNQAPIGSIVAWAGGAETIPSGWMECKAQPMDGNKYRQLRKAIGTVWGGTGINNAFNLPDLQGYFLRGVDRAGTRDKGERKASGTHPDLNERVGSTQKSAFQTHVHLIRLKGNEQYIRAATDNNGTKVMRYEIETDVNTGAAGDPEETRPINAYVHWIIRVE
jgi:microcystin-dependent protein